MEQIQIAYQPVQDRLLLKVSTDKETLNIWLTRRFVLLLLPKLQTVVENDPIAKQQVNNPRHQEILDFQREQSQATHKVHQSKQGIEPPENAEAPLLAHGVATEQQTLHIHFTNKKKLSMGLSTTMAYSMIHLIETALEKTNWGFKKVQVKKAKPQSGQVTLNRVSFDIN